jgi:hypothetical protein
LFARSGTADGPLQELETSPIAIISNTTTRKQLPSRPTGAPGWPFSYDQMRPPRMNCGLLDSLASRPAGSVYNANSGNVQFGSIIQAGQISGTQFHITPATDEHISKREGLKRPFQLRFSFWASSSSTGNRGTSVA